MSAVGHADLVAALEALPGRNKPGGGLIVRCPSHEDRQPSLSIDFGSDGTVLLHCMAGCQTEAIVTAMGATMADLFVSSNGTSSGSAPVAMRRSRRPAAGGSRSFEARYTDGSIAGHHHRTDDGQGDKRIWWDPKGVEVKRLALYRSWEIAEQADPVIIVEGERTALAATAAGYTAVGTYGSSANPTAEALELLRDRSVVLWPDNDDAGRKHMAEIGRSLDPIAKAVRIVRLPSDVPKGWDAADTDADTVRRLVGRAIPFGGLPFRTAREIAADLPAQVDWCWDGLLAFGAITEIDGRPKRAGKTTLVAFLISAIVTGRPFLDRHTSMGPVVFLTEQPPASLREALERAGLTDRDDVVILLWHDTREAKWPAVVEAAVGECRRLAARTLIIDTLPQFAGIRGDAENDAGAALEAMAPLQAAAADDGLAVLVTRHDRKGGGDVGESGRGSTAFTGSVDIVLQLRLPDQAPRPSVRLLTSLSRFDETPSELLVELVDAAYIVLKDDSASLGFSTVRGLIREILADGLQRDRKDITAGLIERGDQSKSTLRDAALSALINAGEVARTGRGVKGDPHLFSRSEPLSPFLPDSPTSVSREQEYSPVPFPPIGGTGEKESNGGITLTVVAGETAAEETPSGWCDDFHGHTFHHRDVQGNPWCEICSPRQADPA